MAKDEGFTNFTFRFENTLRKKAEQLADAEDRALGVWVSRLIAREIKALSPESPPPPRSGRKTADRP